MTPRVKSRRKEGSKGGSECRTRSADEKSGVIYRGVKNIINLSRYEGQLRNVI